MTLKVYDREAKAGVSLYAVPTERSWEQEACRREEMLRRRRKKSEPGFVCPLPLPPMSFFCSSRLLPPPLST